MFASHCKTLLNKPATCVSTKSKRNYALNRAPTRLVTTALFGGRKDKGGNQFQQQPQGNYYPPVYQPQVEAVSIDQINRDRLALGTALRNIGWIAFWGQLVLSVVSGVILLFSIGVTTKGTVQVSPLDACTLVGTISGLISSFLAWTWINTGKKLAALQDVKLQRVVMSVLASTNINLIGMGASILGLQATVGTLVGKTLTTAANYYGPRSVPPPVAFDIFSVQACANTIMAHFVGMVLANWLLRVVSKVISSEEGPSAPPMPAGGF